MQEVIRRLRVQFLRARLAFYRMERSSLAYRLQSHALSSDSEEIALQRLANLRVEMASLEVELDLCSRASEASAWGDLEEGGSIVALVNLNRGPRILLSKQVEVVEDVDKVPGSSDDR